MNFLITLFIFLLVLFLYLHITHQYKRSEDLEIYELDYTHNAYLQEVCNVKQPIVFDLKPVDEELLRHFHISSSDKELLVKDTHDYTQPQGSLDSIALPFESARKLMKSHYFTEKNHAFAEESFAMLSEMDAYLKPPLTIQTQYDYCAGSHTPLRYHTHYRQFYVVTQGKVSVKMTPFRYSRYLHPHKDYDTLEFYSSMNVWDPPQGDIEKVQFLEFDVLEGRVLYVPPYWWYSIKYSDNDSAMIGFTYHSLMNGLANAPDYLQSFLQQQNTKVKTTKVLSPADPEIVIAEKEPPTM